MHDLADSTCTYEVSEFTEVVNYIINTSQCLVMKSFIQRE